MEPTAPTLTRQQLYYRISFGLVVIFCAMGIMLGHREISTVILGVLVMVWVLAKVLMDAIEAYQQLANGPPAGPPGVLTEVDKQSLRPTPSSSV